jgi:hypothetical protein
MQCRGVHRRRYGAQDIPPTTGDQSRRSAIMANLGLWEPFRELDALRREFDRVLDGAKTGFPPTAYSRVSFLPGRSARTYPLFNMSEDKDTLTVEALAPGHQPCHPFRHDAPRHVDH